MKIDQLQKMIQTCGRRQKSKDAENITVRDVKRASKIASDLDIPHPFQDSSLAKLQIDNKNDDEEDSSSTNADLNDPNDIECLLSELNEFLPLPAVNDELL